MVCQDEPENDKIGEISALGDWLSTLSSSLSTVQLQSRNGESTSWKTDYTITERWKAQHRRVPCFSPFFYLRSNIVFFLPHTCFLSYFICTFLSIGITLPGPTEGRSTPTCWIQVRTGFLLVRNCWKAIFIMLAMFWYVLQTPEGFIHIDVIVKTKSLSDLYHSIDKDHQIENSSHPFWKIDSEMDITILHLLGFDKISHIFFTVWSAFSWKSTLNPEEKG